MSKKFTARFRDFVIVDVIKTGPASGLQTIVKKIDQSGAVVQFKYLPKLKKLKPLDGKFVFVLEYKIYQCCYLFEFEPVEQASNINLEAADANAVRNLAKLKRLRQQDFDTNCALLDNLLKAAREGELARPVKDPVGGTKEVKVKVKGKQADGVARKAKSEVLQEIIDLLQEGADSVCLLTDQIVKALIKMVFDNILTDQGPSPPLPPLRVLATTARVLCDEVDVIANSWPHLQLVYTLFAHMIVNCSGGLPVTDITSKQQPDAVKEYISKMRKSLTPKYIRALLTVLQTSDKLERNYIENIILALWDHCPWIIPDLKKAILQYIQNFTYGKVEYFSFDPFIAGTAINCIVGIIVSRSNEFSHDQLLEVVISLYRSPFSCLVYYQPLLLKLATKVANDNHTLAAPIMIKLVKSWPRQSAHKQLYFIEQIQAIFLALVQKKSGQNLSPHQQWCYSNEDMEALIAIRQPLFTQVCLCLESSHSELAATAVRILDHPGVFFPFILFPKEIKPGAGIVEADDHKILGIIIHAFDKIGVDHAYVDIRKTIATLKHLVMDKHGQALCIAEAMKITKKTETFARRLTNYEKNPSQTKRCGRYGCPQYG